MDELFGVTEMVKQIEDDDREAHAAPVEIKEKSQHVEEVRPVETK